MATQFPTNLDNFTNPLPGDKLNSPSHSAQHTNANDAIEAIEAVIGVTGSTDPNTITGSLSNKVPYTGATANVNLGENGISSGFFQADLTPSSALQVGRMQWNDQDGTMEMRLKGNNVTLQIGQEQLIRVVNKTGADLLEANYQCVKISGAQGQRPKVALAQANNDANSADTIGLVTETIANNQEGFVTDSGIVTNINTTGSLQGETWIDGDVLYLSGTVAGRLTKVKPQAPIHGVIVGFVIHAHATQGKIYVKVDNGYELDELHNVRINGVTNGQVLTYNNGLWENQTNGSGTVTSVSGTGSYGGLSLSGTVTSSGSLTFGGTPTGTWPIGVTGNAGTVTNGVYTTGDQTIAGVKTFSGASTIVGGNFNLSGGTANGVAYLDGSKNLTTGSALTFDGTNLLVGTTSVLNPVTNFRSFQVTGTNGGILDFGTNSTIYGRTSADSNGMNVEALGFTPIVFRTNLAEQMRLTSTGLGIGTSSPTTGYKLDVVGNIYASNGFVSSKNGGSQVYVGAAGQMNFGASGSDLIIGTTASPIRFGSTSTNTEWMRLDSAGNVGIGTSSPTAKLTVSGLSSTGTTITATNASAFLYDPSSLSGAGGILAFGCSYDGTNSITGASINSAKVPTTGSGADQYNHDLVFKTSTQSGYALTEKMRIDSAGNLGLGVTPSAWWGTISAMQVGSGGSLWSSKSTPNNTVIGSNYYVDSASATDRYLGSDSATFYQQFNGQHRWFTAPSGTAGNPITFTQAMTLDASGNLGIGSTAPVSLGAGMQGITADGSGGGFYHLRYGGANTGYALAESDNVKINTFSGKKLKLGTEGVDRILIETNGFVGIGTTSPSSKLEASGADCVVKSSSTSGYAGFYAIGSGTNNSYLFLGNTTSGEQGRITSENGGGLIFSNGSGATERMRIDGSGKVLVGAGATASLGKLVVSEASSGTAVIALESQGSWNSQISSTSTGNMIFSNGTNERMRINASGDVGIGTSSPSQKLEVGGSILASGNVTAYSDIRVKDNVESIEGAIGKLNQIRGVTYTRTDLDDKHRRFAGVIAQEIEQVLPEAVFDNGRVKAVDYNATIALLIEAVKEQQKRIDKLETLLNEGN